MAVNYSKRKQDTPKMNHSRISKFKRFWNIGTVIFGVIFFYLIVSLILYMTSTHVVSYQVTSGPLAKNQTYTALVVRSEQIVKATSSGYVSYYTKENNKVRKTGIVYGIGTEQSSISLNDLTDDDLKEISNTISNFAGNYDASNFNETYNFEYEIKSQIISDKMSTATSSIGTTMTVSDQTLITSPADGIVVYSEDGYEDYDVTTVKASDFDEKKYSKTNLKTDSKVSVGDDIYKLVDSETWSILVPLTSRQIVDLNGKTSIRVRFLKDNKTQSGIMSILTGADGNYYGQITFSSGLIRYINDRFLNVELVTNTQTGLKIPISSIVNKAFYTIPEEYAVEGGDTNGVGFMKRVTNEDGTTSDSFVETTLYEHKDGLYYINGDDLTEGDTIVMADGTQTYEIGETGQLEGVYNLNKGYAVFRKISIIDKNEDYCIVEKGTTYGISQYDYIVLNASDVKEDQITAKG